MFQNVISHGNWIAIHHQSVLVEQQSIDRLVLGFLNCEKIDETLIFDLSLILVVVIYDWHLTGFLVDDEISCKILNTDAFKRAWQYNMRLNLEKCTFRVRAEKFLGIPPNWAGNWNKPRQMLSRGVNGCSNLKEKGSKFEWYVDYFQ